MALISIDFHNTLFQCDDWFRLEVETLPEAFLTWRAREGAGRTSEELIRKATAAYREIRETVTATGRESDAVSSVRAVCDRLNIPVTVPEVERGVQQVMYPTVSTAVPIDGAPDLVRRLSEQGHTLAVISSAAYHPFLEWALERHGMLASFDEVVTSASCGIYKSNPAIYRYTIERLGAGSCPAIHIGDSPRFDVAAARSAGMRTILLTSNPTLARESEPDACISALGEAPAVLDRLLGRRLPT